MGGGGGGGVNDYDKSVFKFKFKYLITKCFTHTHFHSLYQRKTVKMQSTVHHLFYLIVKSLTKNIKFCVSLRNIDLDHNNYESL